MKRAITVDIIADARGGFTAEYQGWRSKRHASLDGAKHEARVALVAGFGPGRGILWRVEEDQLDLCAVAASLVGFRA